jgi:hypothetical protein
MTKLITVFIGKIEKGKLLLGDSRAYSIYLAGLEGKEVDVIVRRKTKPRTKNQNQYLFGVVYAIIAEHSGYETTDEVHDAMKQMFLKVQRDNLPPTTRSTTELSTVEFGAYIDSIKMWAANFLGCYIPDPSEIE